MHYECEHLYTQLQWHECHARCQMKIWLKMEYNSNREAVIYWDELNELKLKVSNPFFFFRNLTDCVAYEYVCVVCFFYYLFDCLNAHITSSDIMDSHAFFIIVIIHWLVNPTFPPVQFVTACIQCHKVKTLHPVTVALFSLSLFHFFQTDTLYSPIKRKTLNWMALQGNQTRTGVNTMNLIFETLYCVQVDGAHQNKLVIFVTL